MLDCFLVHTGLQCWHCNTTSISKFKMFVIQSILKQLIQKKNVFFFFLKIGNRFIKLNIRIVEVQILQILLHIENVKASSKNNFLHLTVSEI